MSNELFRLSDYLQYLISSKGRHGLHSPFVYQFNESVIQGRNGSPYFDIIETTRRKMIRSSAIIEFIDFGSGHKTGKRAVSEIASRTAKSAKYASLLYRILNWQKPEFSLELGTGTGISTLYQAAALLPGARFITVEGSEKLTEIAEFNANVCGLKDRIEFMNGQFDLLLPSILKELPRLDYAFIDGNHSLEPTIKYFEQCIEKSHSNTILVFDDINWSEDMKTAWAHIKNHPAVKVTIDIFAFGIVFFRQGQEKEHFKIRY